MINKYNILNGAKYYSSHGLQNSLVFTLTRKYLSSFSGTNKTYSWKSKVYGPAQGFDDTTIAAEGK